MDRKARQALEQRDKERSVQAISNKAMQETFEVTMRILALAINSDAGWGKKRTQRLIDRIMLQFDCILAGTLSGEDVVQYCKDKKINVEVNYEKG